MMSVHDLLGEFDRGEITERTLSFLLALHALNYLENRNTKPA
jgi:hypothetical protein